MAVYVDTLMVHPNAWGIFLKGSCHMTADSEKELHEFAALIGMKRQWFQKGGRRNHYHYDLVKSKRDKAVKLGAKEVTNQEWYDISRMRNAIDRDY